MPQPLYSWEGSPTPTVQQAGWDSRPVWTGVKKNMFSAPELEPQTVQHVASRCTHYATAPEPQKKECSKSRGIWQWTI